jgi:dipeptidyl aminopeptidase/acylaminoacyl peptidase
MRIRGGGLGALLVALLLPGSAPAQERPTEASRLRISRLLANSSQISGSPQWSPDGSQILFTSSVGGPGLWSVSPHGGAPQRLASNVDAEIPRWSPDGKWVAYMSAASGYPELWLHSIAEKRERQLTKLGARVNAFSWSPDGKWIAFSAARYGNFDIWKVSVADGKVYRLTSDSQYDIYPSWTPDSKTILFVRPDDRWVDHDIIATGADGGESRVLAHDANWFDYSTIWTNSSFGKPLVSPDGRTVLFRSYRSGWMNYWSLPLAGGEPNAFAPEEADQSDAQWSPDGKQVAYVSNRNGTLSLHIVNVGERKGRVVVAPKMGVVGSPSWSPDGKEVSYTLATPRTPHDLFVVSLDSGRVRQLTHSVTGDHPEITGPEKITYKSTGGFTISAYLYKPSHIPPDQKLPGILWIHGGPTGQYSDTYFPLAEFFAQQGYVVLAPNIRGSSGYGKAFEDANNGCWGHCDLEDVLAGVDYLKTLPYVDVHEMAITGTSYGGCMSMSAVAFAPGIFQAAIPMSGYGDWVSFMTYNTELRHTKLLEYELGPYPGKASVYRFVSPIYSVKNVTSPVFLIHGGGPTTSWRPGEDAPPASLEFARALEEAYKVYRYKVYTNDTEPSHYGPYYVTGSKNLADMALDMLHFFDQYLKDGLVTLAPQKAGQ